MFDKILQFFVKLLPGPLRKLYDRFEELIVYVYYGVLTTILNMLVQFAMQFGVLALVTWDPRLENFLATSVAWLVAVVFAFYVNKKYVFKSVTTSTKQLLFEMGTFVSARLLSYFMEVGIMQIGVPLYHDYATDTDDPLVYGIFKFCAQVVVTLANYFFSKLIIFRKKKDAPADAAPETADAAEEK